MAKPLDALAKMRLAKRTGARMTDLTDVSGKVIYDEVSGAEYEDVVADRRKKGNFVVGDDDMGYNDDGEDHFSEGDMSEGEAGGDGELPPSKSGAALTGSGVAKKKGIPAPGKPSIALKSQPTLASLLAVKQEAKTANEHAAPSADIDALLDDLDADARPLARSRGRPAAPVPNSEFSPRRATGSSGPAPLTGAGSGINPFARGPARAPASIAHFHPSEYDAPDIDYGEQQVDEDGGASAAAPDALPEDEAMDTTPAHRKIAMAMKNKQAAAAARALEATAVKSFTGLAPSAGLEEAAGMAMAIDVGGDGSASLPMTSSAPPKIMAFERIKSKAGVDVDTCLFYWLDAYEDPFKAPGILHLFGKVMLNERAVLDALRHNARLETKTEPGVGDDEEDMTVGGSKMVVPQPEFVSACLTVTGHVRCMFVLPRDKNARSGEPVQMIDVCNELRSVTLKNVLQTSGRIGMKPVTRNYAFELAGVPREPTQYIKLLYSATSAALPGDVYGETFSHVFGTNTSIMEHFLLKRRLQGPCWLRLTAPKNRALTISHCAVDLEVTDPKCVSVYGGVTPAPPALIIPAKVSLRWGASERRLVGEHALSVPTPGLSVLSLSLKTVLSTSGKNHAHEIVVASLVIHKNVSQDGVSDERRQVTETITFVRHPAGMTGFSAEFRTWHQKNATKVRVMPNEKALLGVVLETVRALDPDALVGHNISGFDLDILLQRINANGLVREWSKVGRLRRDQMPRTAMGVGGRSQYTGVLTVGRLLVDTYLAAKELVRETTYSMAGLAVTQLGIRPGQREDIEPVDVRRMLDGADTSIKLVMHTETDAWLAVMLMFRLQVIPLTKQLTNASGNLWTRSLKGARAERIEYLLLHEFHRLKYVVPDKEKYGDKVDNKAREVEDDEDEDDDNAKGKKGGNRVAATGTAGRHAKGRGKPAYAGGLVLEPKKGLYDKYVLLLDFNSLYPSIIQEYNICFTTVERQLTGKVSAMAFAKAPRKSTGKKAGKRKSDAAGASEPSDETEAQLADEDEEEGPDDNAEVLVPLIPDQDKQTVQGVLPRVIKGLVDKRKAVKKDMASERDPAKKEQLEIRQKAIKILANSMYGCLGFSHSRFYAKPIAALVTSQGRDILLKTVQLASEKGLEVIYGDTDSVMIHTGLTDIKEVKEKGNLIKSLVNAKYKRLEIDIDGIFAMMLLLKKKKYASLKFVDLPGGGFKLQREVKGLDMVRRDWCRLSKTLSDTILDVMLPLSGVVLSTDDIVDGIYRLLEKKAFEMRGGHLPLEDFIITKGLNKHPSDYPDAKNQPHLQVAIAMQNAGRPVNVGDHIPYVICVEAVGSVPVMSPPQGLPASILSPGASVSTPPGPDAASSPSGADGGAPGGKPGASPSGDSSAKTTPGSAISQRAYHPDDIRRAAGRLHVDIDWYMTQQILPPVMRLCDTIQSMTQASIAERLGLDASRFNRQGGSSSAARDDDHYVAKHAMPDEERFKACDKLLVKCAKCNTESAFPGVFYIPLSPEAAEAMQPLRFGMQCSKPTCDGYVMPKDSIGLGKVTSNKLEIAASRLSIGVVQTMRRHAMLSQAGWLVCEDELCGLRTRAQCGRKNGYACTRPGCNSLMKSERPSALLHEQLEYLSSLFNWDRAVKRRKQAALSFELPLPLTREEKADLNRRPAEKERLLSAGTTTLATRLRTDEMKRYYDLVHREVAAILAHSAVHFVAVGGIFNFVTSTNAKMNCTPRYPQFSVKPAVWQPASGAAFKQSNTSTLGAAYSIRGRAGIQAAGQMPSRKQSRMDGGEGEDNIRILAGAGRNESGMLGLSTDA